MPSFWRIWSGAVFILQLDPERARQARELQAAYGKTWLAGRITSIDGTKITVDGLTVGSSVIRPGPALVAVSSFFPGGFTFYTLDGSTPTTSSTLYSGPFTLTNSATVRVLALSSDFQQSVPGPAVAVQIVPFYPVSLTTPGGGSAAVAPAQASYPSNSLITLSATPDAGWTWYVTEGVADDAHDDYEFFGYVIGLYKEWGYFTLHELKTVRGALGLPVERDLSFEPTPMSKLKS